ncbi:MAG TPA: PfkB family carbohydrate kinase [Streptosporangiaceae bacterium]|nr:PfkB family carbohydrate kinase [Streptosporangiaceae bacterium]
MSPGQPGQQTPPGGPGRPGRVIVIGSVNVDWVMRLPQLPAPGQTVTGGTLGRSDGGKGANQAVAAARAGATTFFVGAVGAADGQPSVDALVAEGIDATAIQRLSGLTGHAFVLVDSQRGENQIAVAAGANALVPPGHVTASLSVLCLAPGDVLVLSFELPADALQAAADSARSADINLVVNPSPVLPRSLDLLTGATITLNAGELAAVARLAGLPPAEPGATATDVARRTGAPVIVTLGADGALLAGPGGTEHFPGYRVAVRDTTGAGDTFTGVFAASLAAGQPLADCVARAVAASALAVTRDGARPGIPTAAQIDELLAGG